MYGRYRYRVSVRTISSHNHTVYKPSGYKPSGSRL